MCQCEFFEKRLAADYSGTFISKLLWWESESVFIPFARSKIDEQLDIAEELYGQQIQFMFDDKEADRLLNEEAGYPQDIKERVSTILRWQKHRYQYLFQK